MPFTVQVVIDCADPHGLADWWSETLGWPVEPQDEAFIRQMVEAGHADESDTTTHRGRLVWRVGAAITCGEPQHLRILFQLVPEPKTVKNRLHLDVRTGDSDVAEVRARLAERGATVLHEGRQGPYTWVTFADPEGNEFCV
ncbi:MAG TPA: VOC family protein [Kineosporiaceae bacterium]|nr:VOC family protein [Kineosporiaceae bacterium]